MWNNGLLSVFGEMGTLNLVRYELGLLKVLNFHVNRCWLLVKRMLIIVACQADSLDNFCFQKPNPARGFQLCLILDHVLCGKECG